VRASSLISGSAEQDDRYEPSNRPLRSCPADLVHRCQRSRLRAGRGVHGEFLGLVDFLWRAQRVVGEADGLGKYDGPFALQKEKLREEGLRACGLEVVRNVWDDVWTAPRRTQLGARVRQAFAFAAEKPAVPGVRFRTPSLDQLLTPPRDWPY
jgi:hypothetical protein